MEIQATKSELLSITEFQKNLHYPTGDEKLTSKFFKQYQKTTWYSSTFMKLESIDRGDDVIYTLNPNFHYLTSSYLRTTLPPIKVAQKHKATTRIAWCHNIGTNMIKIASFNEDDLNYQTIDSVWCDDYFQYYQSPGAGKRKNHKIGVGSIPSLEEWTDYLPPYTINVDQPWFYGEETANAYPIFLRNTKNSQVRAEHRYTFRRQIAELLRMQVLECGEWINVHPENYMQHLLVGHKTIPKPMLWGEYAYITDAEIKTYKCSKKSYDIYIKDIEMIDSENPIKYKSTADIPLECHYPCLALFWKAENRPASKLNNYSNYTTNVENLYEGWDPILKTTLKYTNTAKFENLESDHFNVAISRKHFPSSPSEPGYHAYSFAWRSDNFDGEVGIVLSKLSAKLTCKIADNDIYKDPDEEMEEEMPEFLTKVRLLILKKLTIKNDSDSFTFQLN